jgi:hypothetical protein
MEVSVVEPTEYPSPLVSHQERRNSSSSASTQRPRINSWSRRRSSLLGWRIPVPQIREYGPVNKNNQFIMVIILICGGVPDSALTVTSNEGNCGKAVNLMAKECTCRVSGRPDYTKHTWRNCRQLAHRLRPDIDCTFAKFSQ